MTNVRRIHAEQDTSAERRVGARLRFEVFKRDGFTQQPGPFALDSHELAWAAGFFDGEGSTSWHEKTNSLRITIGQAHGESLERFQKAIGGLGRVSPPRTQPGRRPMYQFYLGGHDDVARVVDLLWPWLGSPKRSQAADALARWESRPLKFSARPGGRALDCAGHHGWRDFRIGKKKGDRVCRICHNERNKRYRDRYKIEGARGST